DGLLPARPAWARNASREEPALGRNRESLADRLDRPGERRRGDEGGALRVGEQAREPRAAQERRERHHDGAAPRGDPVEVEELEAVGEQRGDLVSLLDAGRRERVGGPVDAPPQLPERKTLVFEDEGGLLPVIPRVALEEHAEVQRRSVRSANLRL